MRRRNYRQTPETTLCLIMHELYNTTLDFTVSTALFHFELYSYRWSRDDGIWK